MVECAAGVATQASSSTVPCKEVYMSGICTSLIHFGINSSVNVGQGAVIGSPSSAAAAAAYTGNPTTVIIDDLNKLWLQSAVAASVYITYRQ
ncbi:MAG: hypothetical protein ACXADL_11960 [Candidatus Thorarchaeota archaeon]